MTEAEFLENIIAEPDDDFHRGVYADFLDEQGQCERGEFIRIQCELSRRGCAEDWCEKVRREKYPIGKRCELADDCDALRRRENELLFDNWPKWLHAAFDRLAHDVGTSARDDNNFGVSLYSTSAGELGHFDCSFRRGFVAAITCTAEDWLRHGDAIVATQPIEEVTLTTWPDFGYGDSKITHGLTDTERRLSARWPRVKMWHLPPAVNPGEAVGRRIAEDIERRIIESI